jgi:hypothetical protein
MSHDPEALRIVIPTYRRKDHQVTFSHIPKAWRPRTTFVIDGRDAVGLRALFEHTGAEFLIHPPEITTIAAKRAWIIRQTQWSKVLMLDDDLRPCSRRTGSGLPTSTPEEVDEMFRLVERKLDECVHVGISARQGNNRLEPGWNQNKRMMYALGYRTEVVREVCELGRINTREDFDYTLQLLRRGFPNAVYGFFCVDQKYDKSGGCKAEGRTVELSNADAERLAALHPGLIRIVEKDYKTSVPRKEVVVAWAKAFAQGTGAVL